MRLALAAIALAVGACGGGGSASPAPASTTTPATTATGDGAGAEACRWLTAADFAAVGIEGAGTPTDNPEDPQSHYCVYAGTSGSTGGIEFDWFVSASVADAEATYETVIGEGGAGSAPAGAAWDQASYHEGMYAAISVRQGKLVFAISAPPSEDSEADLVALATLVVTRATADGAP